ncbi:MAG: hypothetical protein JO261_00145 [Alphaproteobacteria bacterium]|nr:hypothetical protein [Alphaproteobacteria bacterium]MBV9692083.1 hypothetical protein [Alphaproteobacteria bacterium]
MKIHIDMDMSPDEARTLMGLPDLKPLQEEMLAEMRKRMMAALGAHDPEAMLKAWMPMGAEAFEQFQRFLWEGARAAGGAKKPSPKA